MAGTILKKKRGGKQEYQDYDPCWSPDVKVSVGWKVTKGHSQPGPREDVDGLLNRSGVVKAGGRPRAVQPHPRSESPEQGSGVSASTSSWLDDSISALIEEGDSYDLDFHGDFPGDWGEARGGEGEGMPQLLAPSPTLIPVHMITPPQQGYSNAASARREIGPSASQRVAVIPQMPPWRVGGQATSYKPPLVEDEGNEGQREDRAVVRRSARVQGRNMSPAALDARNESYRMALECTFIQGDENQVMYLLEDMRRLVGTCTGLRDDFRPLLERAKALNRIRYQRGDDYDRLTVSIQAVQPSRVTDVRNPQWNTPGCQHSSPLAALAAADYCRRGVAGAPPAFISLPTIGKEVNLSTFLAICASYRGPPCTITNDDVRPPGLEEVSDLFRTLNQHRAYLVETKPHLREEDRAAWEARFASLRNEYGMLYCLVCCANARLTGPWHQDWHPPRELKHGMFKIVEAMGVTEEQRWQLLEMRERCKSIIADSKAAQSCSMDIAGDLAQGTASRDLFSTGQTLNFLDSVEAAEEAKFMVPATECMVSQAALSNILNPLQSAHMVVYGYMLYNLGMAGRRYEAVDFWRFMAACFIDHELGSWLDNARPPPRPCQAFM